MSRCLTLNFQLSILSKWLAKHTRSRVSFKITTRKRNVYIDIGWPWIWNHCFYLEIWKYNRNKMIVLPSFQLATRLNSQNTNETEFIIELWHIHLFMNIGISNWHNWNLDLTLILFLILFQVLTRLLTSKHMKPFSTYLVGLNGTILKRAIDLLKMRKKNQLKHKNKVRNRLFIESKFFEQEGLYLSLRGEHIEDKRLH